MYAICDALIHTCGSHGVIKKGTLLVDQGKIVDIGTNVALPDNCDILSADGYEIVPGFIDAHSHLGMQSEGLSVADGNEASSAVNPDLLALDGFNPFEEDVIRCVQGGVSTVCLLPGSAVSYGQIVEQIGVIEGVGSVIKTAVQGCGPKVLKENAGLKMALGDHPKRFFGQRKEVPATRMGEIALIRAAMEEGKQSDLKPRFRYMRALLSHEIPARIHVHRARDILAALRLREEYGFDLVLDHVTEGYMVASTISEKGIDCVVGPITLTRRGPELQNISIKNAIILSEHGICVALTCDHPTFPAWYLPYHAGMLVGKGMEYEDALKTITINPAKILGVADKVGSLERGKDADFVLFKGDPLEILTPIQAVFVDGQIVSGKLGHLVGPVETFGGNSVKKFGGEGKCW